MKDLEWHPEGVPDEILNPDLDYPPGPEEASGDRSHLDAPGYDPINRKILDKILHN